MKQLTLWGVFFLIIGVNYCLGAEAPQRRLCGNKPTITESITDCNQTRQFVELRVKIWPKQFGSFFGGKPIGSLSLLVNQDIKVPVTYDKPSDTFSSFSTTFIPVKVWLRKYNQSANGKADKIIVVFPDIYGIIPMIVNSFYTSQVGELEPNSICIENFWGQTEYCLSTPEATEITKKACALIIAKLNFKARVNFNTIESGIVESDFEDEDTFRKYKPLVACGAETIER
jgi:hypothetical protein